MSQFSHIKVFIQNNGPLFEVLTTSGELLGSFGSLRVAENCAHRHVNPVKARRYYQTLGTESCGSFAAVEPERVRVTGFADVNGEQWCRIRYDGDRQSHMLMHPMMIADLPI